MNQEQVPDHQHRGFPVFLSVLFTHRGDQKTGMAGIHFKYAIPSPGPSRNQRAVHGQKFSLCTDHLGPVFRNISTRSGKAVYGIARHKSIFNPIKVVGMDFLLLVNDLKRVKSFREGFHILFAPPGRTYSKPDRQNTFFTWIMKSSLLVMMVSISILLFIS